MKRIDTLEEFKAGCNKRHCARRTQVNHKCGTEYKQEDCWTKYNKKMDSGGYMGDRPNKPIKKSTTLDIKKVPLKRSQKPIKVKKDPAYREFQDAVWQRELKINMPPSGFFRSWGSACQFWKCLNDTEKRIFLESIKGFEWMVTTIQVCHILAKGAHVEEKYNPDNAILGNWIFHQRIDTYKNPLTGKEDITWQEQEAWFQRIRQKNQQDSIV